MYRKYRVIGTIRSLSDLKITNRDLVTKFVRCELNERKGVVRGIPIKTSLPTYPTHTQDDVLQHVNDEKLSYNFRNRPKSVSSIGN
jgi:hypothetical protein